MRYGTNRSGVLFAVILVIFAQLLPATCADIVVNASSSLQEAVDSAHPGDIIHVENGIYKENIQVNKSITLYGTSGEGGNPQIGVDSNCSVVILSSGVNIDGFDLTGPICGLPGLSFSSQNITTGVVSSFSQNEEDFQDNSSLNATNISTNSKSAYDASHVNVTSANESSGTESPSIVG